MPMSSGTSLVRQRLDEYFAHVPWHVQITDISLQYWPNDNVFTDDKGVVVTNIYDYITPSDVMLFKENPYSCIYFMHVTLAQTVVGIAYKDPNYYETGDYRRYPKPSDQEVLREDEMSFIRESGVTPSPEVMHKFRREKRPELYSYTK